MITLAILMIGKILRARSQYTQADKMGTMLPILLAATGRIKMAMSLGTRPEIWVTSKLGCLIHSFKASVSLRFLE